MFQDIGNYLIPLPAASFIIGEKVGNVNNGARKVIYKDIFTFTGNLIKKKIDSKYRDFDQGVWIGKRPLSNTNWGVSSLLLQNVNVNFLHYVVRVDGKNWHLCQVDGSTLEMFGYSRHFLGNNTTIVVQRCNEPNDSFQWFYKGRTKNSIDHVIYQINKSALQYNIVFKNCIDIAKCIYHYARGLCQLSHLYQTIFQKDLVRILLEGVISKKEKKGNLEIEIINLFKS